MKRARLLEKQVTACLKRALSPLATPESVWEEDFLGAGGDVACF